MPYHCEKNALDGLTVASIIQKRGQFVPFCVLFTASPHPNK